MIVRRIASVVLVLVLFQPFKAVPASASEFKIVAYLPTWQGTVAELQLDKVSHVNYAFVVPSESGDGSLEPLDNPAKLRELVAAAGGRGVMVSISVGGWNFGNDLGFERLAASPTARATLWTTSLT